MTNQEPESSGSVSENKSFPEKINPLLTDLLYPSESDEPIETVSCYLKQEEPLMVTQIKDWQMLPPEIYVEEIPEEEFWNPVVTQEDWYGEDEKARTAQFQELKQALASELKERQVFRVGDGEVQIFLLGRLDTGERAGIQTKVIET